MSRAAHKGTIPSTFTLMEFPVIFSLTKSLITNSPSPIFWDMRQLQIFSLSLSLPLSLSLSLSISFAYTHIHTLRHPTTHSRTHTLSLTPLSPSLRPQDFQLQRDHSRSHSVEVKFNPAFHFDFRKLTPFWHVCLVSLILVPEVQLNWTRREIRLLT